MMCDLDRQDLEWLLFDLCRGRGICLPDHEQERLLSSPPSDVDAFAGAVLAAEGLDPVYSSLRPWVRQMVARAFGEPGAWNEP